MIAKAAVAAAVALGAVLAAAHGGVLSYDMGGVTYQGHVLPLPPPSRSHAHARTRFKPYNTPVGQSTIQREWDVYDPITDPTSEYMSCNTNGASLGANQLYATVAAGTQVIAYWKSVFSLPAVMSYL